MGVAARCFNQDISDPAAEQGAERAWLEPYDPRFDERLRMIGHSTGAIASTEATVIPLPVVLTHHKIREILTSKNRSTAPQQRRAELIVYVDTAEAPDLPQAPEPTLFSQMTDKQIERLLTANDPLISSTLRDKNTLADLKEDTERYKNSTTVLHNLERIDKMTGRLDPDIRYTICAVRLALAGEIIPKRAEQQS